MAHIFVLAEGRETWFKLFLKDLDERRYAYRMNNGNTGWMQPNLREVKLFDISVPEQCIPSLLNDLSPFVTKRSANSTQRKVANFFVSVLRSGARLHSIYDLNPRPKFKTKVKNFVLEFLKLKEPEKIDEYVSTGAIRDQWINKIPIGWIEDKKDPSTVDPKSPRFVPNLPYGGELV